MTLERLPFFKLRWTNRPIVARGARGTHFPTCGSRSGYPLPLRRPVSTEAAPSDAARPEAQDPVGLVQPDDVPPQRPISTEAAPSDAPQPDAAQPEAQDPVRVVQPDDVPSQRPITTGAAQPEAQDAVGPAPAQQDDVPPPKPGNIPSPLPIRRVGGGPRIQVPTSRPPPSPGRAFKGYQTAHINEFLKDKNHGRIHILGAGNLGKFIAHSIKLSAPEQPITLILRSQDRLDGFQAAEDRIMCRNLEGIWQETIGYKYEVLDPNEMRRIRSLIVATKAQDTVDALRQVKHRIHPTAGEILLVQNGMGGHMSAIDLFDDIPMARIAFWAGVCSAGVTADPEIPFGIQHNGGGQLVMGLLRGLPQDRPMMQRLVESPPLQAVVTESGRQLHEALLTKLAVNAIINPLTAVYNCHQNGELFNQPSAESTATALVAEIGAVLRASLPDKVGRAEFENEALLNLARRVAQQTAGNTSSMLQDVMAGRKTEIDYINGYIVRQGKHHGIPTPINEALCDMVKRNKSITDGDASSHLSAIEPLPSPRGISEPDDEASNATTPPPKEDRYAFEIYRAESALKILNRLKRARFLPRARDLEAANIPIRKVKYKVRKKGELYPPTLKTATERLSTVEIDILQHVRSLSW
ncbi:ketopantoate reductase PanE/ApbA C terminal-domain-containing protein [Lasiosphaeris hirsuta]|uniref:2-dehydropantoate 2-reductase n=1 Tax=Lasiosphaeris hirsuta TaxID=260670 RepID=A0AA40DSQ1_9PEZI|nr:ketopantoate reductase PanE/ApbA C terminal-domain-containing protein [Lasiosphaeris hirsuta]